MKHLLTAILGATFLGSVSLAYAGDMGMKKDAMMKENMMSGKKEQMMSEDAMMKKDGMMSDDSMGKKGDMMSDKKDMMQDDMMMKKTMSDDMSPMDDHGM